jgi:hypothetical protein
MQECLWDWEGAGSLSLHGSINIHNSECNHAALAWFSQESEPSDREWHESSEKRKSSDLFAEFARFA